MLRSCSKVYLCLPTTASMPCKFSPSYSRISALFWFYFEKETAAEEWGLIGCFGGFIAWVEAQVWKWGLWSWEFLRTVGWIHFIAYLRHFGRRRRFNYCFQAFWFEWLLRRRSHSLSAAKSSRPATLLIGASSLLHFLAFKYKEKTVWFENHLINTQKLNVQIDSVFH